MKWVKPPLEIDGTKFAVWTDEAAGRRYFQFDNGTENGVTEWWAIDAAPRLINGRLMLVGAAMDVSGVAS